MVSFLKRLALFLSPLLIYVVLFFWIDPYDHFRVEHRPDIEKLERQIAYRLNYPLYKLNRASRVHSTVLFLGDSRVNLFDEQLLVSTFEKPVLNMAYGGGTLAEAIETFKILSSEHSIEEVYFGLNFNRYNAAVRRNRVIEANQIASSWLSSIFNKYTIKSVVFICYSYLTESEINVEESKKNKDNFWAHQLSVASRIYFDSYVYPSEEYDELSKMAEYCRENNINLIFFIPPTHMDLQVLIGEYGLEQSRTQFLNDLRSLATVVNLNTENQFTSRKANFTDPFHFDRAFDSLVLSQILHTDSMMNEFKSMKIDR